MGEPRGSAQVSKNHIKLSEEQRFQEGRGQRADGSHVEIEKPESLRHNAGRN